jgi:hypothetical protein
VGTDFGVTIAEQLNELDRKVLGASAVDRASPAPRYTAEVGQLTPLASTLALRSSVYAVGAAVVLYDLIRNKSWMEIGIAAAFILLPTLVIGRMTMNSFPEHFPEAPPDVLTYNHPGQPRRLVIAGVLSLLGILNVVALDGALSAFFLVVLGLAALSLYEIRSVSSERQEDGTVLAVRARQQGRIGRGIYRVRVDSSGDTDSG